MAELEITGSGVIYINPEPGYRSNFSCHSYVVQLSDAELLCTFQRGQAMYSVDSVLTQARSTDGGQTWVPEAEILPADGRFSYHGPLVTRMPDGMVVVNAIRWDRSDPEKPIFNETTGGIVPSDTLLLRSTDNGATWTNPEVLDLGDGRIVTPSGAIVTLSDGRWFLPFDQWHAFNDPSPYRPRTVAYFSSDKGQSWTDPVTFGDGASAGKGHWHGRIIRLRDDGLFTLFWSADMSSKAVLPLHYSFGSPDGREWSTPQSTNIHGQTNWPVDLGNNRMVAIYTVRDTKPPGFFAVFSEDGGKTWDLDQKILVWDATGRDRIGVSKTDSYPRSHDTISFGAPTAIALLNGDIFCSFWCTELSVTHIRYVQLRLV